MPVSQLAPTPCCLNEYDGRVVVSNMCSKNIEAPDWRSEWQVEAIVTLHPTASLGGTLPSHNLADIERGMWPSH